MIDPAVQQLHMEDNTILFRQPYNFLQACDTVLHTRLVIHSFPVTAKTNEVLVPGLSHQIDMVGVSLDQLGMIFGMVPALRQADLRPGAHRTVDAMAFHGRPIFWLEEVDSVQSHIFDGYTEVIQRDVLIDPSAYGLVDIAF